MKVNIARPAFWSSPSSPPAVVPQDPVTLADRFVQSGAGAVLCGLPTALGFGGAALGEALGGLPGRIVGGSLVAGLAAAGTRYGIGLLSTTDPSHLTKLKNRAAVAAGLLTAAGAATGVYGLGASVLGGGLLSGRVLDLAESLLAYGPQLPSGPPPSYVQERTLTASDGVKLQAWWTPGPADAPVCILFHSNATNLEENLGRIDMLRDAGFRVLAVEYRGFGKSEGTPTERGLRKDALAAYEEALKETSTDKIVLMGQSLGGGVAAGLASEHPCAGVLLESAFTSFSQAAELEMGPWMARLARGRYPTIDRLPAIAAPVMVAHGGWDSMMPVEMGRQLAARKPGTLYFEAPHAGHMDVYQAPGFEEQLRVFAQRCGVL